VARGNIAFGRLVSSKACNVFVSTTMGKSDGAAGCSCCSHASPELRVQLGRCNDERAKVGNATLPDLGIDFYFLLCHSQYSHPPPPCIYLPPFSLLFIYVRYFNTTLNTCIYICLKYMKKTTQLINIYSLSQARSPTQHKEIEIINIHYFLFSSII
jgi:hypothetical protein